MKTILAVDGNSIINRAYFGVRPLTNARGQRTEAIYGMMNMILAQIEKYSPDSVQVAFDLHAPTFRHKMYDGYKGNRKGMEEELYAQLEPAKALLKAFGYKILSLEGYEADDILGTVSAHCEKEGNRCLILTGDRDSLQLISESTGVLLVSKGETLLYDTERFHEKYGIFPGQFVDAKALMGDTSDCIPGVPGIGEKTALPLIARYGSLDGVYAALEGGTADMKAGVKTKLSENKDSAYLSQRLAQIYRSVPLSFDFSETKKEQTLYRLLSELGFSSVIARLNIEKAGTEEEHGEETEETEGTEKEALSGILCYRPCRGEELFALEGRLAVKLTEEELFVSNGKEHLCAKAEEQTLRAFFVPQRQVAVYDCKTFLHRLSKKGITGFMPWDDPMLEAYVLCSGDGDYTPRALALKYLSVDAPEEDAALTLKLTGVLEKKLEAEGVLSLYREIELPTAAVLARCEEAGFLIDKEGIENFGKLLLDCMKSGEEQIYAQAGTSFNINSPKQLAGVLYEKLNLVIPGMKKNKSGYSTNAETLEKLKPLHPIVEMILEYRQLSKLRSTYTEGLLKVADGNGRVHTQFTQTVTATGRLSSVEPNLQNIPVRTELGRELRRFFIAPAGKVLIDADYSQIELRLLAHISGDKTMIKAFKEGVDIHAVTASQVFGVPLSAVTPEMRKHAKAVNFGIVYGISAFSLADDIKVSRYEADAYIKSYFATYPGIDAYMKGEVEKAKEEGYVTTMWGRRRYIPELTAGKGMLKKFGERVAMNSPIQGSAADIIKIAMVRVDRALREAGLSAQLILQVHDELIVEADEKDAQTAAAILLHEMEHAAELSVPLTVDLHMGKSWFECK